MEESSVPGEEPQFQFGRQDLIAFAMFFVATVVFLPGGAILFYRLFQADLTLESLSGVQLLLIQILMDFLLVGFILFLVSILHGRPFLRTLHFIPSQQLSMGRLTAGGIFLALTVLLVSSFFPPPSDSPLEKLLTTTPSMVLFVVFGIAFAPLLEETIFRGFIFTALMDLYGWKAAVPLTALLFAALHISQLSGNWPSVAMILAVSYVFTVVRHRTNSVVPSIIMHTTYNATIFAAGILAGQTGPSPN
jgi:membrane protease YdiL (CAAX protease family)